MNSSDPIPNAKANAAAHANAGGAELEGKRADEGQGALVRAFVGGLSAREREHDAAQGGWTPLHAAALRGDVGAVAALLSAGAAVDAVAAPFVPQADAVSAAAAEARYGAEQWARLTRERDGIDAARAAAAVAHAEAGERLSAAEAELAAAKQTLQQAFAEEKTALDEALKSAEDAVGRAERVAGESTNPKEEAASKAEAKQKYLADAHYQEAAQAEEELEKVSEAFIRALAGLSAQELREHLEQLRTVDPEAGVHRSEGIWSFRFHEKRRDLDSLTGQARILGVDNEAITAVTDGDMTKPAVTRALAQLICQQLADVEPAKAQHRAEKMQAKSELESVLSLARRRAKSHREKAENMGKQFLKADAAYERARGMEEQQKQQVQALRDEIKRLHDLAESLQLKHDQPEAEAHAELPMDRSGLSIQPPDAEHRRKVRSLHDLMGECAHSKKDAASNLAAAGGNLQIAAQSWLDTTADVACSFSEMQQQHLPRQRSQIIGAEPEPAPKLLQDTQKSGKEHRSGPESYKRQGLLDLITTSRSRGLYPPKSMDLGFPAAPIKPPGAPSSAPPWMNGPSARKEFARNRLWRQTWDKAVGVGDPPPVPQGVSAGLWSKDLTDEDRHDLIRNLLMGILQLRYGYEKVKPDIKRGDFLERSIVVARDEIVLGVRPIAPEILAAKGQERVTKMAEAEAKAEAEARAEFVSEVNNLFSGHDPDFSMEPHSMPLAPSFRPGGITVYRQLIGLVTFKDRQAKQDALASADKAKSDAEAGDQTIPRVSVEAKDSSDVLLLTQLSEAELRQNLQNSEEKFNKVQREHRKSQHANANFFAYYRIEAAREQVQRASKGLQHRQREHRQAADELEQANRKEPAYNVRWNADVEHVTADDTSTSAKESHQWQVFVNDETVLRASVAATLGPETSGDLLPKFSNTPVPVAGDASAATVGRRPRDSNTVALRNNPRQHIIRMLRHADDSLENQNRNATIGEDEIRQMEQNVANDGIDWEALQDVSTLPTLLKYTVIPAAHVKICKQLVFIAADATDLPVPSVWASLLRASLQIDSGGSCPAESMQLMAALGDWCRRLGPVGCTALHVAAMQGHMDVCHRLLESKADPDTRDSIDGFTALQHAACAEADLDARCTIVEGSLRVTVSAFDDLSGSSSAEIDRVRAKHAVELEKLRSEAARLERKRRVAAQLTALLSGEGDDVASLLTSTAAETISTGAERSTAVMQMKFAALQAAAARGDCAYIVNELCTFPQTLSQADSRGFTLLHWASSNGSADVVELLIGRGADVNKTNNSGQTALHCAKGDVVANVLLNAGTPSLQSLDQWVLQRSILRHPLASCVTVWSVGGLFFVLCGTYLLLVGTIIRCKLLGPRCLWAKRSKSTSRSC
eukprot:COSAG02_NODE_1106_length_14542_cov_4.759468_5_plen_1383_part_00